MLSCLLTDTKEHHAEREGFLPREFPIISLCCKKAHKRAVRPGLRPARQKIGTEALCLTVQMHIVRYRRRLYDHRKKSHRQLHKFIDVMERKTEECSRNNTRQALRDVTNDVNLPLVPRGCN